MLRNRLFIVAILTAAATTLAACGGSESAESTSTVAAQATETTAAAGAPSTTSAPATTTTNAPTTTAAAQESQGSESTETTEPAEVDPAEVDPTCDWDSPRLSSGDASEPAGEGDDLAVAFLGSWQHTHINEGSGFKAVKPTTDIRFVLSPDTFLYCQDVQGATKQAENSAALVLEGDEIVLPSPATGYKIVAWNENTMVWLNNRDGSLYLLQRR